MQRILLKLFGTANLVKIGAEYFLPNANEVMQNMFQFTKKNQPIRLAVVG